MGLVVSFLFAGTPIMVEALRTIGPVIITGIIALVTIKINNRAKRKEQDGQHNVDKYRIDVEQLLKEREFVVAENKDLYNALKEQLQKAHDKEIELARKEVELERIIDDLRAKINTIENELRAWQMGLRVPVGFRLVRDVEEDT